MPRKTTKSKKAISEKEQPKIGRPFAEITAEEVRKLSELGMTVREIADFKSVHVDTIYARFPKELAEGKATLHRHIRIAQKREALKGNARLLVHLGKSFLEEQKPTVRLEHTGKDGKPIEVKSDVDPAEVERTLDRLLAERELITQAQAGA